VEGRPALRTTALSIAGATLVLLLAFLPPGERLLTRAFPQYRLLLEHLPGRNLDPGEPVYVHFGDPAPLGLDNKALRRVGKLLPDNTRYAVVTSTDERVAEDVAKGTQLYALPALRVTTVARADWIVAYRVAIPRTVRIARRYVVGDDFRVARVQR
jgi:hypothetical protein